LGRAYARPDNRPEQGIFDWLDQFVPILLPDFQAPSMEFEEWLAGMPGRRRRPLTKAHLEYLATGWKKRYARFKAFLKTELLPDFDKHKEVAEVLDLFEMLDRLIQGPHDVTHVIAGPKLRPLLHRLKEIWGPDGSIFYGSCGPESLYKWLQRLVEEPGLFFWCDYSMFDNTHSDDSWDFMERLYRRGCEHDADFWRVMRAWRKPRGSIGPFTYKARTMNASGRDDTALANGVLNGMVMTVSVAAAYLGVDLLSLTPAMLSSVLPMIKLSVCGDDTLGCVPIFDEDKRQNFQRDVCASVARFGFKAKMGTSYRLFDCVYLGCRPYPTEKGWFWGKTIGRSTYKMGWSVLEEADLAARHLGICDMHRLCSSHVPVLSDLAKTTLRCRKGAKRTPVLLDPDKPWQWTQKSGVSYDEVTLAYLSDGYTGCGAGEVTVQGLEILIKKISEIPAIPYVLDDPTWRAMVWADEI